MIEKRYFNKLLLFGEYSMILDSVALVVPLRLFYAEWKQAKNTKDDRLLYSARELSRFCTFLENSDGPKDLIDHEAFRKDLQDGWVLDSSIPAGYGLGSSGAVTAAVYDRYAKERTEDPVRLKSVFSRMEAFFHGSSSGIDPLQCWLGKPFRITENKLELLDDDIPGPGIQICLIDTKTERKTKPLVEYFAQQRTDPAFVDSFSKDYLPYVSACIDAMVRNDPEAFFRMLGNLSEAQYRYFRPMIPDCTAELFAAVYDHHFGVKLLGAGGGGCILGFTDDVRKAGEALQDYDVLWLNEQHAGKKEQR